MKKILVAVTLHLLIQPTLVRAEVYTLKDLEILEAEKNYSEFFQHARDIRPELRDTHWHNMVLAMGENYLHALKQKQLIEKKTLDEVEQLMSWPTLKNSPFFLRDRQAIGLIYLKNCFEKNATRTLCYEELKRFSDQERSNPKYTLELGLLWANYRSPQESPLALLPFFTPAWRQDDLADSCKENPIISRTLIALYQKLHLQFESDSDFQKEIAKSVGTRCFANHLGELHKNLSQTLSSGHEIDWVYRLLLLAGGLSEEDKNFLLTLYLLETPVTGPLMNRAWTSVTWLGQNFAKRTTILAKLIALDPLPGKVIGSANRERAQTILDHLNANFPEYLAYYAKSCLAYLTGARRYPNGNPTVYCREFFEMNQTKLWVAATLNEAYKKIKRP